MRTDGDEGESPALQRDGSLTRLVTGRDRPGR
jgi:hypothetical protein